LNCSFIALGELGCIDTEQFTSICWMIGSFVAFIARMSITLFLPAFRLLITPNPFWFSQMFTIFFSGNIVIHPL